MVEKSNVSRRGFLATTFALGLAGFVGSGASSPKAPRVTDAADRLDLGRITCAEFAACLGSTFRLCPAGGGSVEVELVRARELRCASGSRGEVRNPFTLLFRGGGGGERLPQDTYRVEHARLGTFALFVVPVGMGTEPVYEAIFA